MIYFYNPNPQKHGTFEPRFGLENWIDQTVSRFSENKTSINLCLVSEIPDSGIIVFHSGFFDKNIKPNSDQLFICVAADYGRHRYAQIHLFQNHFQSVINCRNKRLIADIMFPFCDSFFVPHWSQPRIKKRIKNEKDLFRIGYFGNSNNFDEDLNNEMDSFCKNRHLVFEIVDDWKRWKDYSDFDLILAIRDLKGGNYLNKPFSKLINALIAGVPMIATNESSSIYFKKNYYPELPIITSKTELFAKILEMKENYGYHLKMIQKNGLSISDVYENEVNKSWEEVFQKSEEFLFKWKTSSRLLKSLFFKSRTI